MATLGPLLVSFFGACILNALSKGSWSLLGWILTASGKRFGRVLGRFWEVLGGFGGSKIGILLDRIFGFRVLVAGAFGEVWAKSKVP